MIICAQCAQGFVPVNTSILDQLQISFIRKQAMRYPSLTSLLEKLVI